MRIEIIGGGWVVQIIVPINLHAEFEKYYNNFSHKITDSSFLKFQFVKKNENNPDSLISNNCI